MAERYRVLAAASVAVYDTPPADGRPRVLMLQRGPNSLYGAGLWALPAGHVEKGESLRACAVRELREEVGLEVPCNDLTFTDLHSSRDGSGLHRLSFLFRTRRWPGTEFAPRLCEPEAHSDMRWFPTDDLPSDMVPHYGPWLRRTAWHPVYTEGDWE